MRKSKETKKDDYQHHTYWYLKLKIFGNENINPINIR